MHLRDHPVTCCVFKKKKEKRRSRNYSLMIAYLLTKSRILKFSSIFISMHVALLS